MIDLKKTGGFIAEKREEKGWNRDRLASELNMTLDEIIAWEDGKRFPPQSILPELCRLLGIKPHDLLYGETAVPGLYIIENGNHLSKFEKTLNGEERHILWDYEVNTYGKLHDQRLATVGEKPKEKKIILKREKGALRILTCPKDTRYMEIIRNGHMFHLFVNQESPDRFRDKLIISDVKKSFPIPPSWNLPEIISFHSKTGNIYDEVKGSVLTFHLLQENTIMTELFHCPPLMNIILRTDKQIGLRILTDADYGMVRPDDIFLPELKDAMVLAGDTRKLFQTLFPCAILDTVDMNQGIFAYKAKFIYQKDNLEGSCKSMIKNASEYNRNYFRLFEF